MRERCSPAVGRIFDRLGTSPESPVGLVPLPRLLAAMIAEEDGRICELLGQYEGVFAKLRDATENWSGDLPSVGLERLLADAHRLSRLHDSEGTVTSEFFLIALAEFDSACSRFFQSIGLSAELLRQDGIGEEAPLAVPPQLLAEGDFADRHVAARILDVNLNRAREALRVLDDYCRFVVEDPILTERIKQARHELVELSVRLPARLLIVARDTQRDVGTGISTARELNRGSTADVALVAVKRLQESLRSLEEYGKTIDGAFAAGVEQLRYRTYTLEKALSRCDHRHLLADCRLYVLLTGSQCLASIEWTIAEAAGGGATAFQLREKDLDDCRLLARARDVRRWTQAAGVLFIMNDRPDIARLAGADGVHLGQDDMSVSDARRILGPDALIGISTHNLEQMRRAVEDGADYIGVGPTFLSKTKDFEQLAGLPYVRDACAATTLPAFAIGGINADNIDKVVRAGARRIAVSAAVARAEEPRLAALALCDALSANKL